MQDQMTDKTSAASKEAAGLSRRRFLTYAGALAGAGILISSCEKEETPPQPIEEGTLDLGSGDTGLANFIYAHEQLAAGFFTRVRNQPYTNMGDSLLLFHDLQAHTLAHRELIKEILADKAIPELELKFDDINFDSKEQVLARATSISDILVMVYNSAGPRFIGNTYQSLAGKIVSVKARHSAFLRDTANPGSFADNVDGDALEVQPDLRTLLSYSSGYFEEKLSGQNLPIA